MPVEMSTGRSIDGIQANRRSIACDGARLMLFSVPFLSDRQKGWERDMQSRYEPGGGLRSSRPSPPPPSRLSLLSHRPGTPLPILSDFFSLSGG